jgi:hypothetical protein
MFVNNTHKSEHKIRKDGKFRYLSNSLFNEYQLQREKRPRTCVNVTEGPVVPLLNLTKYHAMKTYPVLN